MCVSNSPYPCGKCHECLEDKRKVWTFRAVAEMADSKSGFFVTLTYNNESLPEYGSVDKRHCQLFLKRLRKRLLKYHTRFRYLLVSEYGPQTSRAHYHLLLFLPVVFPTEFVNGIIADSWNLGHVSTIPMTPETCGYVTKYHLKISRLPNESASKVFLLSSRRPGIGVPYLYRCKDALLVDRPLKLFERTYTLNYYLRHALVKLLLKEYYSTIYPPSAINDLFRICGDKVVRDYLQPYRAKKEHDLADKKEDLITSHLRSHGFYGDIRLDSDRTPEFYRALEEIKKIDIEYHNQHEKRLKENHEKISKL